jgi:hypothetical protein
MGDQDQEKHGEAEEGQQEQAGPAESAVKMATSMTGAAAAALGPAVLKHKIARRRRQQHKVDHKADHAKTDDAKTEPAKTEPAKTEPAKTEPAKTEHADADGPETPGSGDVLTWPAVLPEVHRGKGQHITAKAGKLEINVPQVKMNALTADQQKIFDAVKANREALPSVLTKDDATFGKVPGYKYHDSRKKNEAMPDELKGGDKSKESAAKKIAWDEISHEGAFDGINTNDDQILTWGKGFSHSDLARVLTSMFKEDPEAEKSLLRAGIAVHGTKWMVVNGDTGAIEIGNDALRLIQYDTKLLTVFIKLGQGDHEQHAANASYKEVKTHGGNVPKFAWEWPENAIRLGAHLSHWGIMKGWDKDPAAWQATGGDLLEIAKLVVRGVGHKEASGAFVVSASWDMMRHGHRLFAFGNGAAGKLIESKYKPVTLSDEELKTSKGIDGHVLIPVYKKPHEYYDLGS